MIKIELKNWRKHLLFGILIIHVLWISNHLMLMTKDEVYSWKMGGYAMYTSPSGGPDVVVNAVRSDEDKYGMFSNGLDNYIPQLREFYRMNWNFNLYCKPISASSLITLFAENPRFKNEDLLIEVYAYRLRTAPLRQITEKVAETEVFWKGKNHFEFRTSTCGQTNPTKTVRY